jgi:hypothetical protein
VTELKYEHLATVAEAEDGSWSVTVHLEDGSLISTSSPTAGEAIDSARHALRRQIGDDDPRVRVELDRMAG